MLFRQSSRFHLYFSLLFQ